MSQWPEEMTIELDREKKGKSGKQESASRVSIDGIQLHDAVSVINQIGLWRSRAKRTRLSHMIVDPALTEQLSENAVEQSLTIKLAVP